MIRVSDGASMMSGPKSIDRPGSSRLAAPDRPSRQKAEAQPTAQEEDDAVVRISAEASDLHRTEAAKAAERTERIQRIAAQIAAKSYTVEPRKVAEAILRHSAPELYQTLVAAGEVEE